MNGRVEDSIIGRMLSADPNIPDPTNAQSYNRYSYVNNNPLTFSDPNGFCASNPNVKCLPNNAFNDVNYYSDLTSSSWGPGSVNLTAQSGTTEVGGTTTSTATFVMAGDTLLGEWLNGNWIPCTDPGCGDGSDVSLGGSAPSPGGIGVNNGGGNGSPAGGPPSAAPPAKPPAKPQGNPNPQQPKGACSDLGSFACGVCVNTYLNNTYGNFGGFIASTFNAQQAIPGLSGQSLFNTLAPSAGIAIGKFGASQVLQYGGDFIAMNTSGPGGFWAGTSIEYAGAAALPAALGVIGAATTPFATVATSIARSACGG